MHEKSDIKIIINSVCYNDITIDKNIDEMMKEIEFQIQSIQFICLGYTKLMIRNLIQLVRKTF